MSENIFEFIKDNLDKTGIKFALGYGLRGQYIKVKFLDKEKFNIALGLTKKEDISAIFGYNIKNNENKRLMTFDIAAAVEFREYIDNNKLKPRFWAGISFNL